MLREELTFMFFSICFSDLLGHAWGLGDAELLLTVGGRNATPLF